MMSGDEIHSEKTYRDVKHRIIIDFPNCTMIQGVIEFSFFYFPCESMKKW